MSGPVTGAVNPQESQEVQDNTVNPSISWVSGVVALHDEDAAKMAAYLAEKRRFGIAAKAEVMVWEEDGRLWAAKTTLPNGEVRWFGAKQMVAACGGDGN